MTQICQDNGLEYVFNIRSCFRNFIIENMPALDVAGVDKKSMGSTDRSASSQASQLSYMIKELKTSAARDPNKLPRGLLFQPDPKTNKDAGYQPKHGHPSRHVDHPWRHLYRAPSDMIINAAILN
jgi:hypothetical protein